MKNALAGFVASLLLLGTSALADTVVFTDNFDTESPPATASVLNDTSFAQWAVSAGTVDLVGFPNGFSIESCGGGTGVGKCVDLDGSTSDAGVMTSTGILLSPGNYVLSFAYSGNQRGAATDTFSVQLGGLFDTGTITVGEAAPFTTFTSPTISVVSATTVSIIVGAAGGDNFGPMFDNVSLIQLDAVPEPRTWGLMILAFGILAFARRRNWFFA